MWCLSIAKLKAFIALLSVRGAHSKNIEMGGFWYEKWDLAVFTTSMLWNRYQETMHNLHFDKKDKRRARLSNKIALMSDVWGGFVASSNACYKPGANIAHSGRAALHRQSTDGQG